MFTRKEKYTIKDLCSLICNMDKISYVQNKDENSFRPLDVESDSEELTYYKSQELSYLLQLDLLGNGFYKGVFNIGNRYVTKVLLNKEHTITIMKEVLLYKYIERECPKLLSLLCPIVAYGEDFVLMEKAEPCDLNCTIRNYHIDCILKLFENYGIKFNDLKERKDNFGIINGKIVITDYDSWGFIFREKIHSLCNLKKLCGIRYEFRYKD